MITNLKISNAKIALSTKGQFLTFIASNTEKSHRGNLYEIQVIIGISNEQERIQYTFSDFSHDTFDNKMKWTQFFYLAPYFFSVLVTNINNAVITVDDREKNINELVNSLNIKFNIS
jgi:hypothetical protein